MHFKPREYQELMVQHMLRNLRCNVWASPGTGKTSASLYAFDAMRMFGEARRGLVVAPKRVARSTWANEIVKWRESFGHLKVAVAVGTEAQRIDALRSDADLVAVNYDVLPWLVDIMGDAWNFDTVFADESGRLKGMRVSLQRRQKKDGSWGNEFLTGQGGSRAKAIAQVAHRKVRRWLNLNGSPAPNGLADLWAQAWFIDGGVRLGRSFDAFEERFFQKIGNDNGYGSTLVPLKSAQAEIQKLLRDVTITIDAKDWFDIKAPLESNVMVDLPPKARKIYDDMERQLFAEIEAGVTVEAFNAGSRSLKCLQIGNGFAFTDTETRAWSELHDEKIEALKSIESETAGEPLLVRYCFVPDKQRILKAFPRARFLDDNPRTEDEWNAGKIPMLVTHAASAGHGLNLQHGGRVLVDFSSDYNLDHDEQLIERLGPTRQAQSGYDRAVYRYRIVARDTIEELSVLPRLKTKASVQESLKDAMKIRRGA